MDQWRDRAGWGFLAIIGLVLIIVGFRGVFGSLLAVFLAPDQMVTSDPPATSSDNGSGSDSGSTSGGGSSTRR